VNADPPADVDEDGLSRAYSSCRSHLEAVTRLREAFASTWNRFLDSEPYQLSLTTDPDGNGTICVRVEWPDEVARDLRGFVVDTAAELQAALDEAIRITVRLLTGQAEPNGLRFPICVDDEEFQDQLNRGALRGLRLDQMRLVHSLQPIPAGRPVHPGLQIMREALLFLRNLTAAGSSLQVRSWGHSAAPKLNVQPPDRLVGVTVEPDGFLEQQPVVARYRLQDHQPGSTEVSGTPNMAMDAAVDVDPPPRDPDDTLCLRTRRLLLVAEEVVRSFERSMGLRHDMPAALKASSDPRLHIGPPTTPWTLQDHLPATWTTEDLEQLRRCPSGLATVADAGQMTLLVVTPDGVFERRIPPPLPLPNDLPQGTAAEWITQSVAAAWGLPDFVFPPRKVAKGTATREIGDGIIVVGQLGLVLQSKSRQEPRGEQRERKWLSKNMEIAGRQAAGTVRLLRDHPAELVNGRGRRVVIDGNDYSWIGVVLIDHPAVPDQVATPTSSGALPVVALLRRDWEFLFDQLRSVHAVAQYLQRVVAHDEPVALGEEALRYYELAQLDEDTAPEPLDPGLLREGRRLVSAPQLPKHPVGSDDRVAHGLYRVILEDIATSPLGTGMQESERLRLLAELDRLEVAWRSRHGRHLIRMLEEVADTPAQNVAWRHRRLILAGGQRQLIFSVCSRLDGMVRTAYGWFVQLRHHDLRAETGDVDGSTTVAVLLTPRPDRHRRWDTTLVATQGDLELTEEELTDWRRLFGSDQARGRPTGGAQRSITSVKAAVLSEADGMLAA